MTVPRIRVGTDVQPIDEVADSLERFGARYTDRLFTAQELETSGGRQPGAAASLAARFAAKEAMIKVLGIEDAAPDLRLIEVVRERGGACRIVLHGAAQGFADRAGLTAWELSLSHGGGVAVATVVAVGGAPVDPRELAPPAGRGRECSQ